MYILGIQFETHDSGIALIRDGKVLIAINEERLSRIKEDGAFPYRSMRQALAREGIGLRDIDVIAVCGGPIDLHRIGGIKRAIRNRIGFVRYMVAQKYLKRLDQFKRGNLLVRAAKMMGYPLVQLYNTLVIGHVQAVRLRRKLRRFLGICRKEGFRGKVEYYDHHLCHVWGGFFASGFKDACVFNIEGNSYFYTTNLTWIRDNTMVDSVDTPVPESAGEFYKLITKYAGFKPRRHAGKITGLAAFGDHRVCYDVVKGLISCEGSRLKVDRRVYEYYYRLSLGKRIEEFSRFRIEDLAAAFQRRLEEVAYAAVDHFLKTHPEIERVVLTGGVAGNVRMNQIISEHEQIREVFVFPAMGDAGLAYGAAGLSAFRNNGAGIEKLTHVYFGEEYSNEEILAALKEHEDMLEFRKMDDIDRHVGGVLLPERKVVARFKGRMEYGPRALGSRSILYHPGERETNDWLNKRLRRTEFMPFAPSILAEHKDLLLVRNEKADRTAEYMTITYDCTDAMKETCKAVVHIDGTARPQLVREEVNRGYYELMRAFYERTGIPCIVNTSFNMHEEPIVESPKDAIRAFIDSRLDYLAIGDYLATLKPPWAYDASSGWKPLEEEGEEEGF